MNLILGTAFSLTLGLWRLSVRIAIEDASLDALCSGDAEVPCEAVT